MHKCLVRSLKSMTVQSGPFKIAKLDYNHIGDYVMLSKSEVARHHSRPEPEFRGAKKTGKEALNQLQYQALRKATMTAKGSRMTTVNDIAGVEDPKVILEEAQARLMRKIMVNPEALGDLLIEGGVIESRVRALDEMGEISFGGTCPEVTIPVVKIQDKVDCKRGSLEVIY